MGIPGVAGTLGELVPWKWRSGDPGFEVFPNQNAVHHKSDSGF